MFGKKIMGIDLGSSYTRVVLPNQGIVLRLPTLVALEKESKRLIAVGEKADEILGKAPNDITVVHPIRNGILSDFKATLIFLNYLIDNFYKFNLLKPTLVLSVPASINSVEKRALEEACIKAGAKGTFFYPVSYLSALGTDINIMKPFGNMVVNIGAGTTESAVLSFNGIVVYNSLKLGSRSINESIINYVKKVFSMMIGENMSEKIKISVCSAMPLEKQKFIEIRGRDAGTGMPKTLTLGSNDLIDAVKPVVNQIISSIKVVLEKTPPELSSDIVDGGLTLCGGGSLLQNFDNVILNALGIPIVKSEYPEDAVALGLYKIIQDFDFFSMRNIIN